MYEHCRFISYLPLSHVAAQVLDIFGVINAGGQVYYGDENALKGTLVESIKDGLPTFFMGVPRVFEKIEEKFRSSASTSSWLKKKVVGWAKNGTFKATFTEQSTPEKTPFMHHVKKFLLLNKIKKAVGLNEANDLIVGAGACSSATRRFFMDINLPLTACFGMTELTGPVAFTNFAKFQQPNVHFLQACGQVFQGVHVKILDGEILFKGRNRFMGYLNNYKETIAAIDSEGFLHSGDVGFLDEQNNLSITGRKKEILKTAGGENIAPAPIETMLKEQIPILSNAVILGDNKKYLVALLTLSTEENSTSLIPESIQILNNNNIFDVETIADVKANPDFREYIQKRIDEVNSNAISRASNIRKWAILDNDFSIDAGEITPTMKVKRNIVCKKYLKVIEQLYSYPNL
eukprot:TRINITY_DN306_c0_g2_i3.p1 TRINITY_DN306_c0_g2~~TRINITY_DN306_c0_g2_i3.p1  ORF type:complete len:404 (-),score=54.75 TRINITY_DN306_c0_g2_i3:107-1318(-)